MDSYGLQGEVLILVNSIKHQEKSNFIDEIKSNQQNKRSPTSCSTQKFNLMQLSNPVSEFTKASSNHSHSQQKQYEPQKNSLINQQKSVHPTLSNLQALKNLPRQIHKNSNIKIQCKTEFPLVRSVAVQQFGWSLMSKQNHRELVDLIWTDTYVTQQLVNRLRPYQKINHFPYSTQMGRKDYLFANLNKMRQHHKEEYNYFAKTWIFPEDLQRFRQNIVSDKLLQTKFYIVKPVASCQGKGIYLARKEDILLQTSQNKILVQEYIENTMLIDGLKFDVRIYVLIKSFEPLNIFVYREGLTRLATNEYEKPNDSNYRNGRMHLTNYAINKNNPCFINNKDFRQDNVGHKRSLASLYEQIQKLGYDPEEVKQKINKIIVKTVLAVYEKMTVSQKSYLNYSPVKRTTKNTKHSIDMKDKQIKTYRLNKNNQSNRQEKIDNSNKCFQLLGFDIMIDDYMQPKLIEINHQPSLTSSSPLDHVIKRCLLTDVFNLLNLDSRQKEKYLSSQKDNDPMAALKGLQMKGTKRQLDKRYNFIYQNENLLGGFSCIYPVQDQNIMIKYHKILPLLFRSEQCTNNLKQKIINYKTNLPSNQNLYANSNKMSSAQKRTQYTCHYINMLSNSPKINQNYQQNTKSGHTQIAQKDQLINDRQRTQGQTQLKIIHKKKSQFNPLHIVPKIKMKKMTQFQVPKKNLSFTIKYKKNKSQNKQKQHQKESQQVFHVNHQASQLLTENRSKTPGQLTFQSKNNKLDFKKDRMRLYQIELTNDHSNNFEQMKYKRDQNYRHTSHQNRIGIKTFRQDKMNQQDRKNLVTENEIYSIRDEFSVSKRKQSIQVQKYSYPIFENKSSTIVLNSGRQSSNTGLQTRSIRKNNDFFQRIYEKQLMTRITKMKSMKEKLQSLNKTRINNKSINKKKHGQFPQQINLQFIQQPLQYKKHKMLSIQKIQASFSIENEQNKQTIYQTIKLMKFQQPKNRRISHIRMQKSTNLKQRINNSLQLFKDQGFISHRKK